MNELTLIPELGEWKKENGANFKIQDWITCEGNIRLAIGYSVIFWPDFITHEDCVFIKTHFLKDNYNEWIQSNSVNNYGEIESIVNHIHILDLFTWEKQSEINYDQVKYLGNVLKEIYDIKLKAQYPSRKFTVTFNGKDKNTDLIDYQLTFWQEINKKRSIKNGI